MIVVGMPDGQLALQMFIAVVLPALVGLVTTRLTPGWGKSMLLVVLTLLSGVVVELQKALQAGVPFHLMQVLMIAAGSFILSMAVHLGIMNPTGLKDKLAGLGIRADPKLEALAVVDAPVMTEQGPVSKEELAAELEYAAPGPDLIAPLQERGLQVPHPGKYDVSEPRHRMEK